ncbi:UNVERIFIED_CONTAM: hypothetical protein Sradi_3177500 [Sesamum radiatum]|uniref:Uncharacterized protein n=1 Tax=Sesamum radiatum TaxID=300843 RepID=A0AAW2REG5_SESRA
MFEVERNKIIEEEVNKLLEAGYFLEIHYTSWLPNVVIVPKASGKWCVFTDFTDQNKAYPKDPYPLPRIDLLVDSTTSCAFFSMMDAYQGATYQWLMNKMFKDLIENTKEVYVDDMLVKSLKEEEHLKYMESAFAIMRTYRMKLNPTSVHLGSADESSWDIWSVRKALKQIKKKSRLSCS